MLLKQVNVLNVNMFYCVQVQVFVWIVQQVVLVVIGQGMCDDFMVENLLVVLKVDLQGKVMFWVYNSYVSKVFDVLVQIGMGMWLVEVFGCDYCIIGQIFIGGSIWVMLVGQEEKGMQSVVVVFLYFDSFEVLVMVFVVLVMVDVLKVFVVCEYFVMLCFICGIGQSSMFGVMGYIFEVLFKSYDVLIFIGKSMFVQVVK